MAEDLLLPFVLAAQRLDRGTGWAICLHRRSRRSPHPDPSDGLARQTPDRIDGLPGVTLDTVLS
jgi:hypothetical protein